MITFLEIFIFFISSCLVLVLSYFKISTTIFQQVTAALLVFIFILLSRIIFPKIGLLKGPLSRLLLVLLSSSFVQLLIISTGGLYSPFLILIHLYTLGASFLLNTRSYLFFLLFSVIALGVNTFSNPDMLALFKNDPGPAILYMLSFIVIVPLAHFLIYNYRLKDKLFKTAKEYAQVGQQREESILVSLQEIIIVTNTQLQILSANTTAEKILHLSQSELAHQPLLKVLPLVDTANNPIQLSALSLDRLFTDKAARIIKGFSLQPQGETRKRPVIIQIRAIRSSQEKINQIVFIITDEALHNDLGKHSDIVKAQQHYEQLLNELKKALVLSHQNDALLRIELLQKIAEDILLAFELQDHPLRENVNFEDVAFIAKQVIKKRQELAQILGVSLELSIPRENVSEAAALDLQESTLPPSLQPISAFLYYLIKKWGSILIEKLLEIGILLASENRGAIIKIIPHLSQEKKVALDITLPYRPLSFAEQSDLLQEYYGNLGIKTHLKSGSGLEGFIAKTLADRLGTMLTIDSNHFSSQLTFRLEFSTKPSSAPINH
ncbi:PAS domain-containing protein [Patescibacteria group bacterium]|nr:PAS domain-containing protein [Patescibacteria group bacterium]